MFKKTLTLTALLLSLSACTTSDTNGDSSPRLSSANNSPVFVAFSGGGYHAQAGASVMMMSLMDRMTEQQKTQSSSGPDATMADIMVNVPALASNSGGSWFLSQAAYSATYLNYLQSPGSAETFASADGYLGQAYQYFSDGKSACGDWPTAIEQKACKDIVAVADKMGVGGLAGFLALSKGDWNLLVRQAVFGGGFSSKTFDMVSELNNTSLGCLPTSANCRNGWADNKALVFASSVLTRAPALTGDIEDLALLPTLEGSQKGNNNLIKEYLGGSAPIMLASMGDSGRKQPDFLPGGNLDLLYGRWSSAGTPVNFIPTTRLTSLDAGNVATGSVNIMNVAANSSAAGGGFIDIPMLRQTSEIKKPELTALLLNNFAPAYKFSTGSPATMQYVDKVKQTLGTEPKKLRENRLVRLADGGFVDNTAVAYMLRHMYDNGELEDGFNIVAMDNYPGPQLQSPTKKNFPTAGDVAALFGYPDPDKRTRESGLLIFKFTGILPHVFKADDYFDPVTKEPARSADWELSLNSGKCNAYLSYTRYPVTTVENTFFGLPGGRKGTLHVFAVLGADAFVVPENDQQMQCYQLMLNSLHEQVTTISNDPNKPGLGEYLQAAFGL